MHSISLVLAPFFLLSSFYKLFIYLDDWRVAWTVVPLSLSFCAANEKPKKSKKDNSAAEYKCLVRATDGKKKISTALTAKELPKFMDSYTTIQKVMTTPFCCSGTQTSLWL